MTSEQVAFSFTMEVAKQIVRKLYPRLKKEDSIEKRAKELLNGEIVVTEEELTDLVKEAEQALLRPLPEKKIGYTNAGIATIGRVSDVDVEYTDIMQDTFYPEKDKTTTEKEVIQ